MMYVATVVLSCMILPNCGWRVASSVPQTRDVEEQLALESLLLALSPSVATRARAYRANAAMAAPGEGDPFSAEAKAYARASKMEQEELVFTQKYDAGGLGRVEEKTGTPIIASGILSDAFASTLPFFEAEENLEDALAKCTSPADVKAAIEKCTAAGGRDGCGAIGKAEKLLQDMEKAEAEGKPMPKAKARKVVVGGATPLKGGRSKAINHDNGNMQR
mmetsp:Transcript_27230/g.42324  ORF Transcript_27230/g.42324 Transcript_27230/m.42324 type:complete len:219 (+) Transcript_27230:56-712(+)